MSDPVQTLGTGHPNLILESDYAPQRTAKRWGFRVETRVDIKKADIKKVRDWLEAGDAVSMDALMAFLIDEVPPNDPQGQEQSRKMIAAAFGKTYPFSPTAKRVADSPRAEVEPPR